MRVRRPIFLATSSLRRMKFSIVRIETLRSDAASRFVTRSFLRFGSCSEEVIETTPTTVSFAGQFPVPASNGLRTVSMRTYIILNRDLPYGRVLFLQAAALLRGTAPLGTPIALFGIAGAARVTVRRNYGEITQSKLSLQARICALDRNNLNV